MEFSPQHTNKGRKTTSDRTPFQGKQTIYLPYEYLFTSIGQPIERAKEIGNK